MDASRYLSQWLTAADVPPDGLSGAVGQVKAESVASFRGGGSATPKLSLVPVGGGKPILLNTTSIKSLVRVWGSETDSWIGRKYRVLAPEVERFGRVEREMRVIPVETTP